MKESGQVSIGGQADEEKKYIAPTVLSDCTFDDPVMQEEVGENLTYSLQRSSGPKILF